MTQFAILQLGGLATNGYVLSASSGEALVIDAGGSADVLIEHLQQTGLAPTLLAVTHCHADHIGANRALTERYPEMQIAIGRRDAKGLADTRQNMSVFVGMAITSPPADRLLDEGDVVSAAGLELKVIETPGHSPGSVSFFTDDLEGAPSLFGGDVLFARSVGRYDIEGGDWPTLERTIREKIFTLPDETVVYPGHGPATTVGEEKRANPFVGADAPSPLPP
jgi:glyoxylase-like metal-dependent hydrolase (beta-lactamase superfamily II)